MVLTFEEPAGKVCHSFEAFSRGWTKINNKFSSYNFQAFLQSSWISSSFKNIFMLLFTFLRSGNKKHGILQVLIINQEILFDQCNFVLYFSCL